MIEKDTKKTIKDRIEKLKKEIDYNRYSYHVLDKSEIGDVVPDSLKNQLFKSKYKFSNSTV